MAQGSSIRERASARSAWPCFRHRDRPTATTSLAELKELLRTARVAVAGELVQRRRQADPNDYLGRGKIEELKRAIAESNANLIACDDELLPRQERNLEQQTGVPVIDRTAIILDIFADHAASAEGKLQVELAQLEYNLARMRGLWTHLERLGGGIGTAWTRRGPDRDGPPPCARPDLAAEAAGSSARSGPGRLGASGASNRSIRRSRSRATRTPANRRS